MHTTNQIWTERRKSNSEQTSEWANEQESKCSNKLKSVQAIERKMHTQKGIGILWFKIVELVLQFCVVHIVINMYVRSLFRIASCAIVIFVATEMLVMLLS